MGRGKARGARRGDPRLLRAAKFCDAPENAAYAAALLSRRKYLDVDPHAILASLPGGTAPNKSCIFFRRAATFPWRSHGTWFLCEMRRWGLVAESADLRSLAERVYRPDLYRTAIAHLGEPAPVADWKNEGAHDPWTAEAVPRPIAMPADRFCDGTIFDPSAVLPQAVVTQGALHNF